VVKYDAYRDLMHLIFFHLCAVTNIGMNLMEIANKMHCRDDSDEDSGNDPNS
jgi:hypothetical protein